MVFIVTGSIHSGKTTRLLNIYEKNKLGDGFVAIKNMNNNTVLGYDLCRLSTKEKKMFILRDSLLTKGFKVACKIGPYCISSEALIWVEESIRQMLSNKRKAIFLDEIGLLELEGKCFDQILREILRAKCDVYITVREELLEQVRERYSIRGEIIY